MAWKAALGAAVLLTLFSCSLGENTYGRDFRMVFMDNFVDCPVFRPVDLYVCNKAGQPATNVNITLPYFTGYGCNSQYGGAVAADTCVKFTLCENIRHTYADGSLANKVVDVTADQDVSVFGFNVEKFSADSYVILPWNLAGQIHYVLSYTPQHIQTQFAIVSKERAKVRIVIPNRLGETLTVDYNGLRYTNGETVQFTLDPMTSFLAQSAGDLTGVLVQSDKPIALFTGNVRTYNDYSKISRDHLVEQVPSTTKWGSQFIYVPTPRANPGDTVRIIARSAGTVINLITDTVNQVTINSGGSFVELELNRLTHLVVQDNKKILVAIIVHSQDSRSVGLTDPADPSLYFLPAVSQYDYEYYMPAFRDAEQVPYQRVYVIVAVPEGSIADFRIDGGGFGTNPSFLFKPTGAGALPYRAGYYQVPNNTDHLINHLGQQGIMVIGYGASDRESFASSLGYNFDTQCTETVALPADQVDNDCDGLVDEETCGNDVDDDGDGLVDEDCSGQVDATGNGFALAFMTNIVRDTAVQIDQIELYIAAFDNDTYVNVTSPYYVDPEDNYINVPASVNSVVKVPLKPEIRIGNDGSELGRSTVTDKGIKIQANKNIVIYGINKKQFSTDGFLALPNTAIGNNYFSYCNFPINLGDDRCQFAAVAVEDNTEIFIELPAGVSIEPLNGVTHTGPTPFSVVINAYQVLEIQSQGDLTGTHVYTQDTKRFSFFAGNVRTRLPITRGSRDHLVEMLPPAETWGQDFSVLYTPRVSDDGDVYKVIASQANTIVNYTYFMQGSMTTVLTGSFSLAGPGDNDVIALGYGSPMSISSNKPILVVQISQSATNRDTDPASIVAIPESQWSSNYRFVTPLSGQKDENGNPIPFTNYIMVTIRASQRPGLTFVQPDGTVVDLAAVAGWVTIPGTDNEGLLYAIPTGQSAILHSDENARYMALIFGAADRETYGNAIGLRLSRTCVPSASTPGDGLDNDCDGVIDEEACNGVDDDLDNAVDEDCGEDPSGYKYYLVFEENVVEFPRNYALEIYVGNPNSERAFCRLETPLMSHPSYDQTVGVNSHDVQQFAVSAALRAVGTRHQSMSITMTCDHPVTVMGVNKETFSNDAFLAFEVSKLGTEYYTVHWGPPTIQTQFAVVAVEGPESTTVDMTFTNPVVWDQTTYSSLTVTLRPNEIFQAQSDFDLTGSKVVASRPVAVFSGNIRTKVVLSASRDHLASQLPPTSAWGTEFMLVPTYFRTVGEIFRVVASQANTQFTFRGVTYNLAAPGDFETLDVPSNETGRLLSNSSVMVMQIMKSQAAPKIAEQADPCFILVVPTDQYVSTTTLVTPLYTEGFYQTGSDYQNSVTLIVPNGQVAGIRLNNLDISTNPLATQVQVRNIQDSAYQAVDVRLNEGGMQAYTITHTNVDVRFSGYLVGIADRESYCVNVGADLP